MADIADLAQKIAFYQAGGKDPGTDTLDKVNTGIGVVDKAIKDVLATKKAQYDNQKTLAETKKLQTDNKTVTEVLGTPAVKSQILAAENAPIPAQDLISGRLDTRQAGIDEANKTAHSYQNTFGNATVGQTEDLAKADLAKAQAEYYRSGQKAGDHLFINPVTREISTIEQPGYFKVSNNTAATIASGPTKEASIANRQEKFQQRGAEIKESAENRAKFKGQLNEIQQVEANLKNAKETLNKIPAGISGGVESLLSKTGYGFPDAATYRNMRPALAVSLYRAVTGDTRLSDADAEARAIPLVPPSNMDATQRQNMWAALDKAIANRKRLLEQGINEIPWESAFGKATPSAQVPPAATNTGGFDAKTGMWSDPEKQKRFEAYKAQQGK